MANVLQKQDMFGNYIDCLVAQKESSAKHFADGMAAGGESRLRIIKR